MVKFFLVSGAASCLLSIILGAFGTHKLKTMLEPVALNSFQVASDYQMSQGLGLILIALLATKWSEAKLLIYSGSFVLTGIFLFCGSLYLLSLTSVRHLGPVNIGLITPLGGSLMIIGWGCLVYAAVFQLKYQNI